MEFQSKAVQMKENVSKVIVGKGNVTDLILTALIAGGHVLLEDVPGTGKTMIAKSFAKSIDAEFARIQFTPDLLPSDITGINYYNQKQGEFVFRKGPVFSNILLADEINRATPRTQSALLECMEEHQVTVDGETRKLGFPFIVIATQNPIETAGTITQHRRKLKLQQTRIQKYIKQLSLKQEQQKKSLQSLKNDQNTMKNIKRFMTDSPLESLSAVCNADDVKGMVKEAEGVHVDEAIMNYIVDIADKTRNNINIAIGVSTRGVINMVKAVRAYAYINGRNYVVPEDVYNLAIPVFAHRILLSRGISDSAHREDVMREVIGQCKVPTEDWSK